MTTSAIHDGVPEFLRDPEPAERFYTIISADDHLVEPPDMFVGRLPTALAERAPKVVTLEPGQAVAKKATGIGGIGDGSASRAGRQAWEYEGNLYTQVGLNAVVGHRSYEDMRSEPTSFADMRPGCYDVHARVRDMDLAGVWASVNFPSVISGFCGTVFSKSADPDLGHAVMRAWNDWFFEEWYGPYPERMVPMGITWLTDPLLGAAEVRRNAERGFRALTLPELPHWLGFPAVGTGYWDPILAACAETETALCLHVGSSGLIPMSEGGQALEKNITLFPAYSLLTCVEWLWSGVPVRFPNLKIVLAEGGIGWVPMLFDRLDFIGTHALRDSDWGARQAPADVVRRNFWFCTLDDPSTLPVLDRVGADRVMIETDYPHSDSTWPDCQELLHRRFTGGETPLSAEAVRLVTHGNAAEVFRHPLPAPPSPEP